MKKKIFFAVSAVFVLLSTSSFAQYNPFSDGRGIGSAGFGFSGWGIPVYVRYEYPVADNVTVGGMLSYQTNSSTYWRDTYFGMVGRGSYHFNELLNAHDEWDFYAGASLGYYFWNGKSKSTGDIYTGSGSNSFGLGPHVGATYFINDNFGFNAELGGGIGYSGGTIGVILLL